LKPVLKILPWCFVALFAAEIVAVMTPKKDGLYHVREFGCLPVLLDGRIQPLDSVARNSLLQMRSTGDLPLEEVPSWKFWHHPKKLKATEWLLEVMTRPEVADTRPIFLIHHPELLGELKLQDKGSEKSGLRYYTFNDLRPVLQEITDQGNQASQMRAEDRTTFQKQALKLANAIMLYHRLKFTLQPEGEQNWSEALANLEKNLGPALAAANASQPDPQEASNAPLQQIAHALQQLQEMESSGYALTIPPLEPQVARDNWQTAGAAFMDGVRNQHFQPAALKLAAIATAYRQEKPAEFNLAVDDYRGLFASGFATELRKGRAEFYYNNANAFLHATIIYIVALVLAGSALLLFTVTPNLSEALRRSAFYLALFAGLVHTFGLIFRMMLEGRPPVTNLYSSAIFIGWAAMLLGVVLERIYKVCIGVIVASLAGFVTLLIAHNLALGGDTMEMLRAVLDTNFWLATHVVVVTLGYASTFVAGLLAIIYVMLGLFTPMLKEKLGGRSVAAQANGTGNQIDLGKALAKMVYGIICFAMLFSFTGTVLGGIWADQSWGRFWGWDPKENGALLIVIWNAAILHARWGGMVRERGLMNMAVFGNIITSFSWFGVNMLGIGLHSYGFMDAAFKWLMLFISSQLLVLAAGALPLNCWRSFRFPRDTMMKPATAGA
jgi:cytochrome c-type biogenesis protein CcsB